MDLSEEERNSLIEQGIDLDELDFTDTDLERAVSNWDLAINIGANSAR